mmetsp:Transcript_33091/g.59842  ORF Transcript_33091/g.59842 Transcript_33091/m.59842 type:complete len:145 (+) Transcript_33091:1919-2353(+)
MLYFLSLSLLSIQFFPLLFNGTSIALWLSVFKFLGRSFIARSTPIVLRIFVLAVAPQAHPFNLKLRDQVKSQVSLRNMVRAMGKWGAVKYEGVWVRCHGKTWRYRMMPYHTSMTFHPGHVDAVETLGAEEREARRKEEWGQREY